MTTGRDPRYKSGEHRPSNDTPDSQMPAVNDLNSLGVEIRSVRREMKSEFTHINRQLETYARAIEDLYNKTNAGLQHCSGHDAEIKGLDTRVKLIEDSEKSDAIITAMNAGRHSHLHADPGRQAVATTVWNTLARNRAIPWAVAGLLALAMILASITGRGADSLIPYHPDVKPIITHEPKQPDTTKP